jgi:hypothetical protein
MRGLIATETSRAFVELLPNQVGYCRDVTGLRVVSSACVGDDGRSSMLNDLNPHCSPEQIFARKPIVEREIVFGSCRRFRRMRDPTTTTARPRSNLTASQQLARVRSSIER